MSKERMTRWGQCFLPCIEAEVPRSLASQLALQSGLGFIQSRNHGSYPDLIRECFCSNNFEVIGSLINQILVNENV